MMEVALKALREKREIDEKQYTPGMASIQKKEKTSETLKTNFI
jgi:hypothetical protein